MSKQTPSPRKTTRRPNGSGTEWKDAKGVWHVRVEEGVNPRSGKRRYVSATGPTRTAARTKLRDKLDRMRRDGTAPLLTAPTLDVWADRWLGQMADRVKPRVLDSYRSELATIRTHIGGLRIDRITPGDVERLLIALATDRSAKTVHNHWIRLRQLLAAAQREGLIQTNPAAQIDPPRTEPARTSILDAGQPALAIAAARTPKHRKWDMIQDDDDDHDMWALMFDLAFETGMRQAERFAITPDELVTRDGIHGIQIDWELQTLKTDAHIPTWLRHRHIEGRHHLIQPKSHAGERFVPLSTSTWLRLHQLATRRNTPHDGLIFTRHGHPLTNTVEGRRWKRALEDAGLPYVTIRSARHFFSTHLATTGAPEDARKAMMGHAKITTTAGYTHWTPDALAALADHARQAIGQPA